MQIKNPAFDYDRYGQPYSSYRCADPRIAKYLFEALGAAKTVLNIGAGAGSYEPKDRYVIAIEPSGAMRAQRSIDKVPAIIAKADYLPFDNNSFDASMAILTIHHWFNLKKGLTELRRVTKGQILILTFAPDALDNFWIADYAPELIEVEKQRYPKINSITAILEKPCSIKEIPIPFDCSDGFQEAFYGRPEFFLEKNVRLSQSAWGFLSENIENRIIKTLSGDLRSGVWDKKYGYLRHQSSFSGGLRLIVANN